MCIRLKRRWSRLLTKVLGSWAWFLHWSSEKSDKSELPESNILATSDLRTFLKGTELFFLHLEKLPHDPPQSLGSTESRHRACHRWTFLGMTCHLFRRCGPVSILLLCRWDGPHGHLQFAFPNLFMTSQADFLLQKSFLIFSRLLRSFPGHRFGWTTTSPGSQDMPCKCSTSWDPVIKGMYCSGWSWMVQSFGGHNLPCDRTCLVFSLPTIPANSSIDFAKACASQSTS